MSDFRTAQKMVRQRKFYNAIELYLSFVQNHPKHKKAQEALFEVGNLQQTILNEPEKALFSFQKLVNDYPVSDYTIRAQQRIAGIQKSHFANYHQAIIEYEKLLKAAPNFEEAASVQFEIAQCYTLLHNYAQAAIEYQTLIKRYPSYEKLDEVYFQMGNNAYIGAKYEEAVLAYETVEKNFPKSSFRVQAIFGSGNAYEEIEEVEKAKAKYEAVLNDYPSRKVVVIRLQGLEKREKRKNKVIPGVPTR